MKRTERVVSKERQLQRRKFFKDLEEGLWWLRVRKLEKEWAKLTAQCSKCLWPALVEDAQRAGCTGLTRGAEIWTRYRPVSCQPVEGM